MPKPATTRIVLTTAAGPDEAARIGRTLVEEHLAPCATLVPSVESIYEWQGKTEQATETLLLLKTEAHDPGDTVVDIWSRWRSTYVDGEFARRERGLFLDNWQQSRAEESKQMKRGRQTAPADVEADGCRQLGCPDSSCPRER